LSTSNTSLGYGFLSKIGKEFHGTGERAVENAHMLFGDIAQTGHGRLERDTLRGQRETLADSGETR